MQRRHQLVTTSLLLSKTDFKFGRMGPTAIAMLTRIEKYLHKQHVNWRNDVNLPVVIRCNVVYASVDQHRALNGGI